MNRDHKAALVEELAEQIRSADAVFAVDYRGISVSDAAQLRTRLRESDTRFRIVKNSLSERAAEKAGAEALKSMLEGPTAFAFVGGDAALAAKALGEAGRALGTLEFKGGLMDGAELGADEVRAIARLPARPVLESQLIGTIASPMTGLVRGLNGLIAGLAIQLQQIAEQKPAAEPEPQPEAEAPEPQPEAEKPQESEADEAGEAESEE